MKLIGIQLDIAWEDPEANRAKVRALLGASPPPRGSLVALPEMFSTGFSMNVQRIAEDEIGATHRFLRETAKQYGVYLVGGLVTRAGRGGAGKGRNEAVVADPDGKIIARYQKIHPYAPGGEAEHYQAGKTIELFDWRDSLARETGADASANVDADASADLRANPPRVAPLICYDLRFPELFRDAMLKSAKVFVVIASWPSPRVEHWVTLLRARAIENQAYVLGVNRCGSDPFLPYPGRSLIVDFRGEVLADAGDRESVIAAPVDPAALDAYRAQLPFLADARMLPKRD
jgi:omega-amidase